MHMMSKDNREKFYYTDAGGREKTINGILRLQQLVKKNYIEGKKHRDDITSNVHCAGEVEVPLSPLFLLL